MDIKTRNNFGDYLKSIGLNGFGVEVGVAEGNFSEILLSTTGLKKIYFVDPWKVYPREEYDDGPNSTQAVQDERFKKVSLKLEKYKDRAEILRMESVPASKIFKDDFFDFVYIDASHTYNNAKQDILSWYPKVKAGGVISGHDYLNDGPQFQVKRAVDEFCEVNKINVMVTGGTRRCPQSWYFVKPLKAEKT